MRKRRATILVLSALCSAVYFGTLGILYASSTLIALILLIAYIENIHEKRL